MDLYGIANNLDIFMRTDAKREFPAITRSMIVPGQVLRSEATRTGAIMYLERYIDEDPESLYLFIQCDARKGDASRDMAHRFFDKFFYDILHMPSTYDRNSGAVPTQENPEFGRYDRNMAIHREILPAMDDTTFKRYYDQQVKAAQEEMARAMGIDPSELGGDEGEEAGNKKPEDDSDVIDMVDDGSGNYVPASEKSARSRAVASGGGFAVGAAKPIFYCVDFHAPAAMQLGYNGDSSNIAYDSAKGMGGLRRLGHGGPGRRQLREKDEEETNEGLLSGLKNAFGGDKVSKKIIKCLKELFARRNNEIGSIDVAVAIRNSRDFYSIDDMFFTAHDTDQNGTLQIRVAKANTKWPLRGFLDKLKVIGVKKISQIDKAVVYEKGFEKYANNYPVADASVRGDMFVLWVAPTDGGYSLTNGSYADMLSEEDPEEGAGDELEESKYGWFVREALENGGADECERCGDPACKNGELCGLGEGDPKEDLEEDMKPEEFFCKAEPETAPDAGDSEGGEDDGEDDGELEETDSEDPDELEDRKRAEDRQRRRDDWEHDHPDDDMPDDDRWDECEGGVVNESFSTQQIRGWNRLIMG
jgi:hypothetical protein